MVDERLLVEAAQADDVLARAVTELRFLRRTRVGSVLLEGVERRGGEPVVVKLSSDTKERTWMTRLATTVPELVPRLVGTGERVAGTNVGWIALQKLDGLDAGDPIDAQALMDATARFHRSAPSVAGPPPDGAMSFIEMSAGRAATRGCPARTDFVVARLADDLRWVAGVAPAAWTHGDLTFDNGLRGPDGVVLIDPIPSARCWAMDAAWCEVASGVESTPPLVPLLASARREIGLSAAADDDLERLATLSLAWASLLAWAMWPRDEPWWIESTSAHIDALSSL